MITFVLREDRFYQRALDWLAENWQRAADAGKPLAVTVTDASKQRTTAQNKKIHALFSDIAGKAWVDGKQFDADTWKVYYAGRFIGTEDIDLPDGKRITRPISTTTLSVDECKSFIEAVQHHATADLQIELEQ